MNKNILLEKLTSITGEFKETTNEFKEFIKKYGFPTGSYHWDVDTENSDVDMFVAPHLEINFGDAIMHHNGIYLHEDKENDIDHYFQEGFQSCYVLIAGKIFNILFMHNQLEYERWVYATTEVDKEIIKNLNFRETIRDKSKRVEIFEEFKDQYKK
jgi:hypothetical protein